MHVQFVNISYVNTCKLFFKQKVKVKKEKLDHYLPNPEETVKLEPTQSPPLALISESCPSIHSHPEFSYVINIEPECPTEWPKDLPEEPAYEFNSGSINVSGAINTDCVNLSNLKKKTENDNLNPAVGISANRTEDTLKRKKDADTSIERVKRYKKRRKRSKVEAGMNTLGPNYSLKDMLDLGIGYPGCKRFGVSSMYDDDVRANRLKPLSQRFNTCDTIVNKQTSEQQAEQERLDKSLVTYKIENRKEAPEINVKISVDKMRYEKMGLPPPPPMPQSLIDRYYNDAKMENKQKVQPLFERAISSNSKNQVTEKFPIDIKSKMEKYKGQKDGILFLQGTIENEIAGGAEQERKLSEIKQTLQVWKEKSTMGKVDEQTRRKMIAVTQYVQQILRTKLILKQHRKRSTVEENIKQFTKRTATVAEQREPEQTDKNLATHKTSHDERSDNLIVPNRKDQHEGSNKVQISLDGIQKQINELKENIERKVDYNKESKKGEKEKGSDKAKVCDDTNKAEVCDDTDKAKVCDDTDKAKVCDDTKLKSTDKSRSKRGAKIHQEKQQSDRSHQMDKKRKLGPSSKESNRSKDRNKNDRVTERSSSSTSSHKHDKNKEESKRKDRDHNKGYSKYPHRCKEDKSARRKEGQKTEERTCSKKEPERATNNNMKGLNVHDKSIQNRTPTNETGSTREKSSETAKEKNGNVVPRKTDESQEQNKAKRPGEKPYANVQDPGDAVNCREKESDDTPMTAETNQVPAQAIDKSVKYQPTGNEAEMTSAANHLEVMKEVVKSKKLQPESSMQPNLSAFSVKDPEESDVSDMSLDESFDAEASNIQLPSLLDVNTVELQPCHAGGGDQATMWYGGPMFITQAMGYPGSRGLY